MTGIKEALEYNNERISELGPRIDALLAERDAALERAKVAEIAFHALAQKYHDVTCGRAMSYPTKFYKTCTGVACQNHASATTPDPISEERTTSG